MDYREEAHALLERIHIARRDALREFRTIDRVQISEEAERILIAGAIDPVSDHSRDSAAVMGIPIERVPDGPEFKLIFR